MDVCFILSNNNSSKARGSFKLLAKDNLRQRAKANCKINCSLKANITKNVYLKSRLDSLVRFKTARKDTLSASAKLPISSSIRSKLSGVFLNSSHIKCESKVLVSYVDKFNTSITVKDKLHKFQHVEKLYPIGDVSNDYNGNFIVNEKRETVLYESVNEGIYLGNPTQNFGHSVLVSDEKETFIHPSSIYSTGTFKYVCVVDTPSSVPTHSFLHIRAAAPIKNYASNFPPSYKLYEIYLRDTGGKEVVKYKDVTVKGDADYQDLSNKNFSTYIVDEEINNARRLFSDPLFPTFDNTSTSIKTQSGDILITQDGSQIVSQRGDFTLEFLLDIYCEDKSFNDGFSHGYEDRVCETNFSNTSENNHLSVAGGPLSSQSLSHQINPSDHIRITAIEIANSGSSFGFSASDAIPLSVEVDSSGQRLSREILVSNIELNNYTNNIYPETIHNSWESINSVNNSSEEGCSGIRNVLRSYDTKDYITLNHTTISESGKLILEFSHEPPRPIERYINGAFKIGFNSENKEFDYAGYKTVQETDSYFEIDDIYLKVIAKKDANSTEDFYLDVVGYSDDNFLAVTSRVGGFLQNISGTGSEPLASGFIRSDELSISSESFSEKDEFYVRSDLHNAGGDHYLVDQSSSAHVTSTDFQEYLVPLKIYKNSILNKNQNFNISSFFEHLHLDLCPIPSGASIAYISLLTFYKPSNAIPLYTLGYKGAEVGSADAKLFPSSRKEYDNPINTGLDYTPLSSLSNIPHGYGFDSSLKTNYSRRWRNTDGLVAVGPFDFNGFDFSFYNPQLAKPFFGGYFSFNDDVGNNIISEEMYDLVTVQGSYVGNYDKIHNVGLRFNSSSLFNNPTSHTTIDWTSINGYQSDPLYGQIADSFDNAIRVSGDLGYISFPTIDLSDGCAIFVRFSPDVSMSGIDYNLYNSGIIFSKHDAGNNLELALGYDNGYLTAYATDSSNNIISIQDSISYSNYTYPLSVLVTYNNNNDSKLVLYTDNEKDSYGFSRLRAESGAFVITQSLSDLTFGFSHGEGVGFNGFITDIAISAPSTQVIDVPLSFNPDTFLDSIHTKYWSQSESHLQDTNTSWSYVDKDLDEWHLGAFNICEFSPSFDRFTSRFGKDYVIHRIKSDGVAYSQHANLSLPQSVDSSASYHTQIENDMLRFPLSAKPESFASPGVMEGVRPRISNSFVRGYSIFEEAFVVDTVIDHVTYNDIIWDNGKIGPKLIVSLYTKNKDDPEKPYKNLGLINRSTHYLAPSGCINKISSKFSFEDLFNEDSEEWSSFDQSQNSSELDNKFMSKDIEDMFLQYDIVYPSGLPYDSSLSIYGITVTLTEALHKARTLNNLT